MISLNPAIAQPQTTGNYLVLLPDDDVDAGVRALCDSTGVSNVARAMEMTDRVFAAEQLEVTEPLVFDRLGVAVVLLDPDQLRSLNVLSAQSSPILAVEPERIVYALSDFTPTPPGQFLSSANLSADYLRGYRDAIVHLVDNAIAPQPALGTPTVAFEEIDATWGLQATRTINSPYSGQGIRVAVLDTGLDLTHPDFVGRQVVSKSFVPNETAQDGNGHGTHVIGTACGPLRPLVPPRYGIGYETVIYAGKVLSDRGQGADRQIFSGIEWALANDCQIISMSLGSPSFLGQPFSRLFERVAQRALRNGSIIIAASGNDSDRRLGQVSPVSYPANSPSVLAVAALNRQLEVAFFSNGGLNPGSGQVDIAAPGVDIYSSFPVPIRYQRLNGTSMATPHVSGIAALYAQATGATGQALGKLLIQSARRLPLPATDVGAGLVQAPIDI
jgi:subtilisin family serine protease